MKDRLQYFAPNDEEPIGEPGVRSQNRFDVLLYPATGR